MSWSPHITVACMIEHDSRLLFVEERSNGKVVLNQPAGHVERGESLVQAALRETMEETACEVEVKSLLGLYSHHFEAQDITYYRICFIAELLHEYNDRDLDDEIIQRLWLSSEEAMEQSHRFRSPLVQRCLDDYLSAKSYPLAVVNELSFDS